MVDDANTDGDLRRLRTNAARRKTIPRERFIAVHRIFDQRTSVVVAALLPFVSAVSRNTVDGFVSPACSGYAFRPRFRALARRNRRRSAAPGDRLMALLCIVCTVTAYRIDGFIHRNLRQQTGQCTCVVDILMRHQRRAYLTSLYVQSQMDLTPRAPLRVAVLAHLRRRASRPCYRQPDEPVPRSTSRAISPAGAVRGGSASYSRAQSGLQTQVHEGFAQSPERLEASNDKRA